MMCTLCVYYVYISWCVFVFVYCGVYLYVYIYRGVYLYVYIVVCICICIYCGVYLYLYIIYCHPHHRMFTALVRHCTYTYLRRHNSACIDVFAIHCIDYACNKAFLSYLVFKDEII